MKKQHTRKQIVEAIAHWQSVLKKINESEQTLMSRLYKVFGKDVVDNQHMSLSQNQFKQLYKMLNVFLFDNMLNAIPVKLMNIDDIIDEWHKQDEVEEIPQQDYNDKRNSYGFYINFGDIDETLPKDKQIFSLKYRDHTIYINKTKCDNMSFMKQVAVLCHEMIHYFDALYGQYRKFHQISYIQNREKDDHLTATFKQKKKEARAMEIPVSSYMDNSWRDLPDEEFMKMIEQVDESKLVSLPLSSLKSSDYTKIGKHSVKFMSYGQL